MFVTKLNGHPVRLDAPHDLSFVARWGTVFAVLDEQDSGNLCLGVEGAQGRLFLKYAGASTTRYSGAVEDAVVRLRQAGQVYQAVAHPNLVTLREAVDVGSGHALVFDWTDAVPIGRQYGRCDVVQSLAPAARAAAVQQIYDVHVHVADRGWTPVDLYDGSVMLDPDTGRVTLCDLDVYQRAPVVNEMGRMWGSSRFMSPEEYELGAQIDEVSTVHTLGALAHTFLGDDRTRSRAAWVGTPRQFDVATRALEPDRGRRWESVVALAHAWRAA